MNGHDEPIITTLPEPLSSGVSIIASEHLYLGIDIPSPPWGESDIKAPPIGKASPIMVPSPPKSPPKFKGSMTAEVNDLLSQAVTEASSCESEHSPLGKIATVVVTMSPPWKSEVSPQLVDTSSQASIEEAEASLEDLPANISLIAAAYSSGSVSPLVDPSELQANANRAINNMLHLKRSIDIKRQRAIWELGVMLHQGESQETTSVAEAKAICLQVTLDAWTVCSWSVLEAKTHFLAVVKKAKTIRGSSIQKAEATCSRAISKAAAPRISQAVMLHREHGRYMQDLEEQAFREESRSHHNFLSSCQVTLCHSQQLLRETLATLYHILFGESPLSPLPVLS